MKTVMNLIFNGASNKKFLRDFLNHLTPRENSKLKFPYGHKLFYVLNFLNLIKVRRRLNTV